MSRCLTSTRFAEFCMSCFRVSTWRNQKERKKIGFLITHKCFIGLVLWVIYLLTREPIREEKTTFASAASSTFNCFSSLVSGFKVVSHSCAGIISPNPKEKMWRGNVLILNHEAFKQDNRIHNWNLFQETQNSRIYWWSYLWTSECYMMHLQEMYSGGFWVLHHRSNSVPAFPSQPENSDQWENGTDTQPQKKKACSKRNCYEGTKPYIGEELQHIYNLLQIKLSANRNNSYLENYTAKKSLVRRKLFTWYLKKKVSNNVRIWAPSTSASVRIMILW